MAIKVETMLRIACGNFIKALIFIILLFSFIRPDIAGSDSTIKIPYKDISKESGLDFFHFNGMTGKLYFPEMTGQGGGFIDFDNDGDLDIYLLQGCLMGKDETYDDALYPPKNPKPMDRLYRNDLTINKDGSRSLRFVDVTENSGINGIGYGMGVTSGDFNNDGWPDLYVTNYGPNKMLYNNKDGTFKDVTQVTGTGNKLWGSSAAAFDYDRDGWLDLYVCNYVLFDIGKNIKCYANNSRPDYCGPSAFQSQKDKLFHNRGDGTFEDVTAKILIDYHPGSGLGITTIDVNNDGWMDFYVTNDGQANQLWINQEGKTFIDDALFSGSAINQNGQAEASMGVGAGDLDNDGYEDLIMTHIMGETNTLFINDGNGLFEDKTIAMGLSSLSFPYTSFGINWTDYDNDGWLDLFIVNGAVLTIERLAVAGDPYPIHQPNQLFHNEKGKRFVDVTKSAGNDFKLSEVSRGAAFGDVDNDGDVDVLICNNNGNTRLLRNEVGNQNNWLGLRLVDSKIQSDLLGSRVVLKRKGKKPLLRQVRVDGSYCSANDPRIVFGLGDSDAVDSIEIFWSDGSRESWDKPISNKYTTLKKGLVK